MYCSRWSNTRVHGPEHLLQYVPTGQPEFLEGRPLFHRCEGNSATAANDFSTFQTQLSTLQRKYSFSRRDVEEWSALVAELSALQNRPRQALPDSIFWPDSRESLEEWLEEESPLQGGNEAQLLPIQARTLVTQQRDQRVLTLAETARKLVDAQEELRELDWDPVTTVGAARENDTGIRQVYDARARNLVVLDNSVSGFNPSTPGLLGDWQARYLVGYVRARHESVVEQPSRELSTEEQAARNRARRAARKHAATWGPDFDNSGVELDVVLCEPWTIDPVTKTPLHPLWVSRDVALATDQDPIDTSWEVAKTLPWKEVKALPLLSYEEHYAATDRRPSTRRQTPDFLEHGVSAVTSLKDLSEVPDSQGQVLITRRGLKDLRHTLTLEAHESRATGVLLPADGLRHMELTDEIRALRAELEKHGQIFSVPEQFDTDDPMDLDAP